MQVKVKSKLSFWLSSSYPEEEKGYLNSLKFSLIKLQSTINSTLSSKALLTF